MVANGKILFIDLESRKYTIESLPAEIYSKYIGSRGIGGFCLRKIISKSSDCKDVPLMFLAGTLAGSSLWSCPMLCIMSISPLSGTVGISNVGGKFAFSLKSAGFDAIILQGKSSSLCSINISNSNVEFKNVPDMKGLEISEISKRIEGGYSYVAIGPAAENGVLFSSIIVDSDYSSNHNGLGAVMAQKNVKCICVKGDIKVDPFDQNAMSDVTHNINRLINASSFLKGEFGISNYTSGALYDLVNSRLMLPTDNFKKTYFSKWSNVNAAWYVKKYNFESTGCYGCAVFCKKKNNFLMPEFEAIAGFSALVGNDDPEVVVEANNVCMEKGMDIVSSASAIASYSQISGTVLSGKEIINMLKDIASNSGIGASLCDGSFRYLEKMGRQNTSMSVKKQDIPMYDPRGAYGIALSYVTSNIGASEKMAYPIGYEILNKPVALDRFSFTAKARVIKMSEDINAVFDSLGVCKFMIPAVSISNYVKAFRMVTGIDMSMADLLKAGERIYFNEKIINSQNGFNSKDDDLPMMFFNEPGTSSGCVNIKPIDRGAFLKARSDYYFMRGLDENAQPFKTKCKELDLECRNF